jgi:hypothetical protein
MLELFPAIHSNFLRFEKKRKKISISIGAIRQLYKEKENLYERGTTKYLF